MNKSTPCKVIAAGSSTASKPAATKSTPRKSATPDTLLAPSSSAIRRASQKVRPQSQSGVRTKAAPIAAPASKQARVIAMLRQPTGATLSDLMDATGWQAHSVRGVISGALKKRLHLNVVAEASKDGTRRYRIKKHA